MIPRPCTIPIPDGGRLLCYFHCWTRQAGNAAVCTAADEYVAMDPLELDALCLDFVGIDQKKYIAEHEEMGKEAGGG